jgi:hypothetical protein
VDANKIICSQKLMETMPSLQTTISWLTTRNGASKMVSVCHTARKNTVVLTSFRCTKRHLHVKHKLSKHRERYSMKWLKGAVLDLVCITHKRTYASGLSRWKVFPAFCSFLACFLKTFHHYLSTSSPNENLTEYFKGRFSLYNVIKAISNSIWC